MRNDLKINVRECIQMSQAISTDMEAGVSKGQVISVGYSGVSAGMHSSWMIMTVLPEVGECVRSAWTGSSGMWASDCAEGGTVGPKC